jgi:hypothetical protein
MILFNVLPSNAPELFYLLEQIRFDLHHFVLSQGEKERVVAYARLSSFFHPPRPRFYSRIVLLRLLP